MTPVRSITTLPPRTFVIPPTSLSYPHNEQLHAESGRRLLLPSVENSTDDNSSARNQSQIAAEECMSPVGTSDSASKSALSAAGHARSASNKPTLPTTARKTGSVSPKNDGFTLTGTMERGAEAEAPQAVWLGRIAAVMEARGDRDEAVRLYGKASAALLTGEIPTTPGDINGCRGTEMVTSREYSNGGNVRTRGREVGDRGLLFPYSARAHHLASMIKRAYRRHFQR